MKRILRTLALCLAVAIALPACAHGPHYGHNGYHGSDVAGALIIGGVIGAVIANNQRPEVIVQQPVIVQPQPVCYRQPLYDQYGRFVTYRQICQ